MSMKKQSSIRIPLWKIMLKENISINYNSIYNSKQKMRIDCQLDDDYSDPDFGSIGRRVHFTDSSSMGQKSKITYIQKQKKGKKLTQEKDVLRDMCRPATRKTHINLFRRKLRQVIVQDDNFTHPLLEDQLVQSETTLKPFKLHQKVEILLSMALIVQTFFMLFYSSLGLVFDEVNEPEQKLKLLPCLVVQICLILSKFLTVNELSFDKKKREGQGLRTSIEGYLRSQFVLDFITLIIVVVDMATNLEEMKYIRLILVLNMGRTGERVRNLELTFIKSFYNEQYWELFKLLLINFLLAYILTIFLLLMTQFDLNRNWLVEKNLAHLQWGEKFIWAYYWATTIVLSVGFGGVSPATTDEALCIIFIETLGCIWLTYNISHVGNIIRDIASYSKEKETSLKALSRIQDKFSLSEEVRNKLKNYLIESTEMKRLYNLEEEEKLTTSLPKNLSEELKKESNSCLLLNIPFLRSISQKYLSELATLINRKLSHPEEILMSYGKTPSLMIVSNGQISLNMHRPGKKSHGKEIERKKISPDEYRILSLDFLLNKVLPFDVKSCNYATVYHLDIETFQKMIKDNPSNYQYYKTLKDKDKHNQNEFEVFTCEHCENKDKHTMVDCPKFHFVPIKQFVINKHLQKINPQKKKVFPSRKEIKDLKRRKKYQPWKEFTKARKISGQLMKKEKKRREQTLVDGEKCQNAILDLIKGAGGLEDESRFTLKAVYHDLTKEIRDEISKVPLLLNEQKVFEWDLHTDEAFDFEFYFTPGNPSNIAERLSKLKNDY